MSGHFADGMVPVKDQPINDIGTRMASCRSHPDKLLPSSIRLPIFEYRGAGSIHALIFCGVCDKGKSSHGSTLPDGCTGFEARGPAKYDLYTCYEGFHDSAA